tara:strand:+ start:124 stop:330 length:207 start_codon:yes stop_codon:yes gene_type:complete
MINFIEKTNYCESKGYDFKIHRESKGIRCDLYKDGKFIKKGTKFFKDCVDAQKECYSQLYKHIKKPTR